MTKKPLGDAQLGAWKALLNAHAKTVSAIETRLSAAGEIPLTWYDVLWSLRKQGEKNSLRFRALQEEVVLSRSALSRVVDALAKAKLVKKIPREDDARGLDVELTETGKKALAGAWSVYSQGIHEVFAGHLSEDDCVRLSEILGKVTSG